MSYPRAFGYQGRPLRPTAPASSAVGGGKSPYRLGRDFERATRGRLERRGYFVMRAYGSKGKIDLLAVKGVQEPERIIGGWPSAELVIRQHIVLGIQCKRRGDIGSTEWNELIDLCESYGITPVVCTKVSERTVAFYRLDERRLPRKPGRPWTAIDVATGLPQQQATLL